MRDVVLALLDFLPVESPRTWTQLKSIRVDRFSDPVPFNRSAYCRGTRGDRRGFLNGCYTLFLRLLELSVIARF